MVAFKDSAKKGHNTSIPKSLTRETHMSKPDVSGIQG